MEGKDRTRRPACASCTPESTERICTTEKGLSSKGCPTLTRKQVLIEANREYETPEIREFARQASIQEAECYANRHQRPYIMQPSKTRIVEICEFARKLGYRRLGLAFCIGLTKRTAPTLIRSTPAVVLVGGRTAARNTWPNPTRP